MFLYCTFEGNELQLCNQAVNTHKKKKQQQNILLVTIQQQIKY